MDQLGSKLPGRAGMSEKELPEVVERGQRPAFSHFPPNLGSLYDVDVPLPFLGLDKKETTHFEGPMLFFSGSL